jgi:hypothetical protein
MEKNEIKKCSSKRHEEKEAIYYCLECRVYMCNECNNFHSGLFSTHNSFNLKKNTTDIFNSVCKENNHMDLLNYYCKTHNQLICVKCISKIKGKGNGQHSDCTISFIEDIKEEKKNKLSQNIKYLEELSVGLEQSLNSLNEILDKINTKKENLEKKIQNFFTKIRNALNEREDKLLSNVGKLFDELYLNGNTFNDYKKLPNRVKISLEQGKKIDTEWTDDTKLMYMINSCLNIENNINSIKNINDKIKKINDNPNIEVKVDFEEKSIDKYIKKINSFGNVYHTGKNGYKLAISPININEDNNVLLLTNNKSPILNHLLQFNNAINKIEVKMPNVLPNMKCQNFKNYKIMIYDLEDGGFEYTSNIDEISNYLTDGGNIIITHDQWTYMPRKTCTHAKLLGAKIQSQNYKEVNEAKIFNNNHPIFVSFYNLYMNNQNMFKISLTHKTDTVFENQDDFFKDLLIELNDGKHGEYLLVKEIGKGKLIFWNAGHTYNLTDFEKKLFMNFIYWLCQY